MATELKRGTLFNPTLQKELVNAVKGHSALAKLSKQEPISFNGNQLFVFNFENEIDVVAENGKKTHGGVKLEPVKVQPLKVEYGARITDEFLYASEAEQIDMLKPFVEGFSKKLAKGLDLMAFHGINPRTKEASSVIGENHFDNKVTQTIETSIENGEDAENALEDATGLVLANEVEITGFALSPKVATSLGKLRVNGVRQYPEFGFGARPESFNNISVDVNQTVYNEKVKDLAIVGDFETAFRWGYAKQIPMEIIKYGDPDNSGKDLKGYNQIYIRCEAYIGWGILDGKAFARVVESETAE